MAAKWFNSLDTNSISIYNVIFFSFQAQVRNSIQAFINTMWSYWKPNVPPVSSVVHGNNTEDKAAESFKSLNPQLLVVPSGEL